MPGLLLILLALWLWHRSGVAGRDALVYAGYELAFVVAPGWLVVWAISPGGGQLRRLVLGWPLGYAIQIAAFVVTAALGVRGLIVAYPPLVAAAAVALRIGVPPQAERDAPRWRRHPLEWWLVAALAGLFLLIVYAAFFGTHPLPGTVGGPVEYHRDFSAHIAYAAEALHHWPMRYPLVSGTAFPYHLLGYMYMAGAAEITGLGLPLIVLRLLTFPLVLLLVLQVAYLGRRIGRGGLAAPFAVGLVLFAGEIDLDPRTTPYPGSTVPFLGLLPLDVVFSPTFLLGLVLFLGAVIVALELVERGNAADFRRLALLAVLAAAAAGTKAAAPPVLVGGLLVFALVQLATTRRFPRAAVAATLTVAAASALAAILLYRNADEGVAFDAGSGAKLSYALQVFDPHGASLRWLYWTLAGPLGAVFTFGALVVGVPLLARRRPRLRLRAPVTVLLAFFAVGLVPFYFVDEPALTQTQFTGYGTVLAAIVSGAGLERLRRRTSRADARIVLGAVGAWALVLLAIGWGVGWRHEGEARTPVQDRHFYALWIGVVLAVLVAAVAAALLIRARRPLLVRLLAAALVVAAAVNLPLDVGPSYLHRTRHGEPLYDTARPDLTPGLLAGYDWLRTHTSPQDVLAVDSYSRTAGNQLVLADNFALSAFAERRVFLEGWVYAPKSYADWLKVMAGRVVPYRSRLALNERVFAGDRHALDVLTGHYGVRYLVVDLVHRPSVVGPARLGRRVFANDDIAVYAVGSVPPA